MPRSTGPSRAVVYSLFALFVVMLAMVTVHLVTRTRPDVASGPAASGQALIGGAFSLQDVSGETVTERTLLGRPSILFFGFTHCPEICPTKLYEISLLLKELGPDGDRVNAIFVSVDPERDTPELIRTYLGSFDARIRGLTGPIEAIERMAKAYRVYFKKVPLDGGDYTVDHTALVYLFDRDGRFVAPLNLGPEPERAAGQVRALLN